MRYINGLLAVGGARRVAAFRRHWRLSWTSPTVKMYRERMDQATRTDIAAAAAAHRELGNAYDDAVAESLIDRIGAEIDKRVEAKLGARPQSGPPLARAVPAGGHQGLLTGAGIGAGITGLLCIFADHGSKHIVAPVLVIWIILAIAGLGVAVVNRYRNIPRG
jgi:galactokinase/mevalonate kinase-like predicted kinase